MATISWPETLPYEIERGSYELEPVEPQHRTPFSAGPARMRRKSTRGVPRIRMAIVFKGLEYEIFKNFFDNDLRNGTSWFILKMYVGGEDYVEHTVRFSEAYQMREAGHGGTRGEMNLEARRLLGIDGSLAVILGVWPPDFITTLSGDLHTAVHVEYPKIDDTPLVI